MANNNIEDVYPLTPVQEGMLFHSLFAPEEGIYITQFTCTLKNLDLSVFERVWQRVTDRHAVLRTAFAWNKVEKPLQIVGRQVKIPIERQDWRRLAEADQEVEFQSYLDEDRRRGYELSRMPLMRLALFQINDDRYKLLWSYHHLLMDGWSGSILLQEVFSLYEAYSKNHDFKLDPPRPYRDYIAWLQKRDLSQAEKYWRNALKGFTAPTPLEFGQTSQSDLSTAGGYSEQRSSLSLAATSSLKNLAREHQLTINTFAQGVWALLLSRYSNEPEVLFGVTVSGRPSDLSGVESMVGLFINTLPARVQVTPEEGVLSWLKRLQAQQTEQRQYEYTPLVRAQEWSEVSPGNPLFESILVFENYPVGNSLREQKDTVEVMNVGASDRTNYPITLGIVPANTLSLQIIYDCRRFDDVTITKVLGQMATVLEQIVANPHQQLSQLTLLTDTERRRLLNEWSNTGRDYSDCLPLHELFERQVKMTPDKIASVYGSNSLTYFGLSDRASKLAILIKELQK